MVTIGPLTKTSPSVSFYVDGVLHDQSPSTNQSRVDVTVRCYGGPSSLAGSSKYLGSGDHWGGIDGVGWIAVHHKDSNFLPLGYNAGDLRWAEGATSGWITHAPDGTGAVTIRMRVHYGTVGPEEYTATLNLPRIAKRPSQTPTPVFLAVSTTDITYAFTTPSDDGGSGITGYDHQVATNAAFTAGVQNWVDNSSPATTPALAPGTTHYIRYRAVNAVGAGDWSNTLVQVTLPAVAPGFTVIPNPSGVSARLVFSPPGGVSGVDRYQWDKRDDVTGVVTTDSATLASVTVPGLVPGRSYSWRASAVIGAYVSPITGWVTVVQPQPNINAGDYFDGGYAAADLDYAWTGTAGASASTATGDVPTGWLAQPAGGTAVLWQATAGLVGLSTARATVITDCTDPGSRFGQRAVAPYAAVVTHDASYVGSIYVRLSRENRVAAELTWLDSSHTVLSRTPGDAELVPANTWTRLWVGGAGPEDAAFAAVKVIDVVGTGHSLWRGGDVIEMDAAMITLGDLYPYFDGGYDDTAEFRYEWAGTAHASESTRTALTAAVAATGGPSLVDPLCPPPPAPPRPPIIPNPCIETSGIWRRTYRQIPATEVSDWLAVVPTFELVTQTATVRQVRIRIYENPLGLPPEAVNKNIWLSEQIVSYIPADTMVTIDGVTQRVWANVGDYAPVAADHLLYGSNGTPPVWPVLSCGIGYLISVDLPVEVPQADSFLRGYLTTRT